MIYVAIGIILMLTGASSETLKLIFYSIIYGVLILLASPFVLYLVLALGIGGRNG